MTWRGGRATACRSGVAITVSRYRVEIRPGPSRIARRCRSRVDAVAGADIFRTGADAEQLCIGQPRPRLLDRSLQGDLVAEIARAKISVENDPGSLHPVQSGRWLRNYVVHAVRPRTGD